MKISESAVKHPVTTTMVFLALAVLGIVSLFRVGQEMFPNVTVPTVVVVTANPGAGPLEMEAGVTKRIEEAVSVLSNIKSVSSETSESVSVVVISFNWGTDMDNIIDEVRESITEIEEDLPEGTERSRIFKFNPEHLPSLSINVYTESEGINIRRLAEDEIVNELQKIKGVAQVNLYGGKEAAVVISMDLDSLSKLDIPVSAVLRAFQGENINLPGGSIRQEDKYIVLRTIGEFEDIEDVENVLAAYRNGIPVFISDIADTQLSYLPQEEFVRVGGREGLRISIMKQPGASTIAVNEAVIGRLEALKAGLPPSIRFEIQENQADSVRSSIGGVANAAWQGGILAVLVLLFFLRNIRSTLIITVVIPVSVIATFSLIDLGGFTINMVSLMGITMGIGMFVDNSIVVLESSYRKQLAGLPPDKAAVEGSAEVGRAITASTLTTVSVFIPMLFIGGMAGLIFTDLSWTVSFSLLISLLVALTLIPVLCSRYLKVPPAAVDAETAGHELSLADVRVESRFRPVTRSAEAVRSLLERLDSFYERLVSWALRHSGAVILSALLLLGLSIGSILLLGMEFLPEADEGNFTVNIETRVGSSYAFTEKKVVKAEDIIGEVCGPSIITMSSRIGSSGGRSIGGDTGSNLAGINVSLIHKDERDRSIWEIVDIINRRMTAELLDVDHNINIEGLSSLATLALGDSNPIVLELAGDDIDGLSAYARRLADIVEETDGTRNVQISYRSGKPEMQFVVQRKEALSLGLSPREIAAAIRTAYNGTEVSRMTLDEEDYGIVAMLEEEDRNDPEKISGLFFINPAGTKIPLENLVDIKNDVGPLSISRKDKSRIIKVTAALSGSRALSRVSDEIQTRIDSQAPPPYGIDLAFSGSSSEMSSSFQGLFAALFLAVALVYMVMASQFESLLHPLIVMFSVPFAIIGLVAALLVTGTTFNLLAFVGAIMLVGIVVNNAIVLIDYINILRERGLELKEAIITGGRTRLKPILMTSITTILGLLPMALGLGTGAEIRAPMGRAVVGGLITSTAVTLVLIPALYWVIESRLRRARSASGARKKKGKQLAFFALFSCLLLITPTLGAEEGAAGSGSEFVDGEERPAAGADGGSSPEAAADEADSAADIGSGGLTLQDALAYGLANSETVKIGRHRIKEAEYGLYEARARKFPSLSLQASASYLTNPQDDVVVKAGELGELPEYIGNDPFNPILLTTIPLPDKDLVFIEGARNTYFQLKATLSQPIFTWGKINGAVDAASYRQEIAASDLRQSERELKRDIEAAYFGAVFARESAALLKEAEDILESNVKDRKESYDTGVINYQKVLEAEAQLAGIKRDRIETEEGRRSALAALAFYTGTETEDAELTTGFGYSPSELDADVLYEEALRDSPELERLSLQIKQAEANVAIQEGGHLLKPDFSLDISFDLSGQHIPFSEDGWTDTWNANLIISIGTKVTLFDGLSSVWKIEQAKETLETASLGLSRLTRGVELQIRKGIEEIRKAEARISAAEAGLKLAEERYRNARVSYENELITRVEERGAKLAEIQSRLELLMAHYEYRTAVSELAYTVNGLPE